VVYRNAYPSIDLKFYGNNRSLEYDIIVHAGGDPSRVKFRCDGIDRLEITDSGDLAMQLKNDDRLIHRRPIIYQEIDGRRLEINGKFRIRKENSGYVYGFEVAAYDDSHALIIDPIISYSTFLGGSSWDMGHAITADDKGNAYVAGWTESFDFPLQNPIQEAYQGEKFVYLTDIFITKINAAGDALEFSTFLGGRIFKQKNAADFAEQISVDASGNIYIAGYTNAEDFPTHNAMQPSLAGGSDAILVKISATGNSLEYSTYLGGSGDDRGFGIAIDDSGNALVTGYTASTDFPVTNAIQKNFAGKIDGFIAKFNASGSALLYSTYLGGSSADYAREVAVDRSGRAYVVGYTNSIDFPTRKPLQKSLAGNSDIFVTRVNSRGDSLDYSTYLGGSRDEQGYDIVVDRSGNAFVTGKTNSDDFPTRKPLWDRKAENFDAFVTQIKKSGKSLAFSTYLGGNSNDTGYSIALDKSDNVYVTGETRSTDFPLKNPIQARNGGMLDVFVTRLAAGGKALEFSTYLGGDRADYGRCIAVDNSKNVYLSGWTNSSNFPMKNSFQDRKSKSCDIFVTKIIE
jgi:hypothetical protein